MRFSFSVFRFHQPSLLCMPAFTDGRVRVSPGFVAHFGPAEHFPLCLELRPPFPHGALDMSQIWSLA